MYIQMVTALVLQLIQCVVHLPSAEKDTNSEEESNKKVRKIILRNPTFLFFFSGMTVFVGIMFYNSGLEIRRCNFVHCNYSLNETY